MLKPANTKITEELVFISVKNISETITGILCHAVQCTLQKLLGKMLEGIQRSSSK